MAETYGVLDYRALPARLAATLYAGLGQSSRSVRAATKRPDDITLMIAMITDSLQVLLYRLFGGDRPTSLYAAYMGTDEPVESPTAAQDDIMAFDTAEEFERAWAQAGGGEHGR